jgi:hypothetical protein
LLGELVRFPIKNSNSNSFIEGNLAIPDNPIGIVVFAHGSGSSKNSKRNQLVSEKLNKNNIATLLFDLLSDVGQAFDSQVEKMTSKIPGAVLNKFNLSLLTKRLSIVTDWVLSNPHREITIKFFCFKYWWGCRFDGRLSIQPSINCNMKWTHRLGTKSIFRSNSVTLLVCCRKRGKICCQD